MDKINEFMAWLTLALGWWLYKHEYLGSDKGKPEKVAVSASMVSDEPSLLTHDKFWSERLHGESIISTGLSELMKKKQRLNKGRRVEDRQAAEQ